MPSPYDVFLLALSTQKAYEKGKIQDAPREIVIQTTEHTQTIANPTGQTWTQIRNKVTLLQRTSRSSNLTLASLCQEMAGWMQQVVTYTGKKQKTAKNNMEDSDDKPVTMGMLKQILESVAVTGAHKALQMQAHQQQQQQPPQLALQNGGVSDQIIQRLIEDPTDDIIDNVTEKLAEDPTDAIIATVTERLAEDPTDEIKDAVVNTLAEDASDYEDAVVEKLAEDPTDEIRELVVNKLAQEDADDYEDAVVEKLAEDPTDQIKQLVVHKLAEEDASDYEDAVVEKLVRDPTKKIKASTIKRILEGGPEHQYEIAKKLPFPVLRRAYKEAKKARVA